jgi:hypothetical protein
MSRVFQAHGDVIRAQFEPQEVELLRTLEQGVSQTLEHADDSDPIIERLFPTAVVGDDDADAELRRLLRSELLGSRQAGLRALVEILDRARPHRGRLRVDLTDDEPLLVLGVLNDLRLAIGARIGIENLDREDIPDDDALRYRLAVMDHLGWWQEQLITLLDQPEDTPTTDEHGDWP